MEAHGRERVGVRGGVDARLGPVADAGLTLDEARGVLAAHGVDLGIDLVHRLQHLDLVVADHLRVPERRGLHRRERHHLDQVVLHHVAQRADAVVVPRTPFDTEGFGDGDLDLVDMTGVEHRLDEPVREAEHEHVLHGLFAEEVVDAEDLVFAPTTMQLLVQRERGLEVRYRKAFRSRAGGNHWSRRRDPAFEIFSAASANTPGGSAR